MARRIVRHENSEDYFLTAFITHILDALFGLFNSLIAYNRVYGLGNVRDFLRELFYFCLRCARRCATDKTKREENINTSMANPPSSSLLIEWENERKDEEKEGHPLESALDTKSSVQTKKDLPSFAQPSVTNTLPIVRTVLSG